MQRLTCKKNFIFVNTKFHKDKSYEYYTNFEGLNHFIKDGDDIFPFDGEVIIESGRPFIYDYFYTMEEMRDINIKQILE